METVPLDYVDCASGVPATAPDNMETVPLDYVDYVEGEGDEGWAQGPPGTTHEADGRRGA